jgi:hypothetical protein
LKRALAAAFVLVAQAAHAEPTTHECIDADTRAQELRRAGKLHDALARLDVCTHAACPEMVRADCSERIDEIERVMPSVVFDVKTSDGHDVVDARVEMDGKVLRERLTGRPVTVDPGDHTFVVTARGQSQTVHALLHEGEKDRRVAMTVALDVTPPQPHASTRGDAQRIVGGALGATGLFGLALGSTFGAIAIAQHSEVAATCPDNVCPTEADRAAVEPKNAEAQAFAAASTVAFVAAAVLAAAGVVVYFTAPRAAARVGLGPGGVFGAF